MAICKAPPMRQVAVAPARPRLCPSPAVADRGGAVLAVGRRPRLCPSPAVVERGGGAVLDRPGFSTVGPDGAPVTDSAGSKLDSGSGRGLGGGSWRVLLLDSPRHTEPKVVAAITEVVPGTDVSHAANCYHTSRSIGMAIVTTAAKEHSEFFCQQLWQRGCRVNMEPDSTTL